MRTIHGRDSLREWRAALPTGTCLGFVPTMGALHEGHLALVRRARTECGSVAMSIFVNPKQFLPGEDLERYPRDPAGDAALAASAGTDILWFGDEREMYPPGFATRIELPSLSERLCGLSRPGHFAGVAVVVLKLFSLFRPHRAYFGEKDWQQSAIIRRLVRDLELDLEVVRVPIVREEGGLALSSRNRYLSPRGRQIARAISRGLFAARDLARTGELDAPALVLAAARELVDPAIAIEYVELFDPESLEPVERVDPGRGARLAVAARIEGVRLIDNMAIGGEEG